LSASIRIAVSAAFEVFVEPELGRALYGFDTRADADPGNGVAGWIAKVSVGGRLRF
jgi:hypothetical protein